METQLTENKTSRIQDELSPALIHHTNKISVDIIDLKILLDLFANYTAFSRSDK